ncbi:energy transducer TonB [Scytonema tolypothrichoides VB-61278]|nr:energy transducer TonB [Scytonema tolypothrichoides VB-61278]
MSFSGTAIEQRGKEEKALKAFLAFSVIASLGLHASVLASGIVNNILNLGQEIDKEPIQVAIIETPAPKPVEKPIEPVKPFQQALKPKIVEPIKPLVQQPLPVLPKPPVLPPVPPKQTVVVPKPPVVPKQTVVVPKPPVQPKRTVVVTKPVVPPPKIVTPPVEKPEPLPKIPQLDTPIDTPSKPDLAPTPQPDQNLKRTLRTLRTPRAIPEPAGGGGGGGGGGNSPRIATGSGEGTVRSGTGTGTGIGTGSGSGIGSGTGSGIGSGSGSGIGSGTGSGIGSGTGSGIGSGTGSGIGSGTGSGQGSGKAQVATAPKPRTPAPTQLDFTQCVRCDIKYPEKSKQRGIEGRPGIAFDVDKNGNVNNIRLVRPSGHKELDQALIDSAKDFKLNSAAFGRQNVQLFANFAIQGSRSNQEAQQRQRERQQRLEAQQKRQQEAQQRNREPVANEEENSGRRRRAISTTPEVAPQTTPETGIRRGQDVPSTPTESNSEQATPQPPTLTQPLEQNSSSEQNEQQPSGRRKINLGTSDNQNDLGDPLRLPQNQSQPSEQVPSDSSGNNQ